MKAFITSWFRLRRGFAGRARHITFILFFACAVQADLDILVLGSSQAVQGETFSADQIAVELQNILDGDEDVTEAVNVVFTDIFKSKHIPTAMGGSGDLWDFTYGCHSLLQYYYWPEGRDAAWANLSGTGGTDWDYVVLVGDPYIISNMPGYYALGVQKAAEKAAEGGAQVILLMQWPHPDNNTLQEHFEEFTYRAGQGAKVPITVAPAGLAWDALSASKKESSSSHPTPNGSYLAAASVYASMMNQSASASVYDYDNSIADLAFDTEVENKNHPLYSSLSTFVSPFSVCGIKDNKINYHHTGTSTENDIKNAMNTVFGTANVLLTSDNTFKYHINYGRANTYFEEEKRYKIDASKYMYSFGFPMHDNSITGNTTMLYGLDSRVYRTSYFFSSNDNGTDLGIARYMLNVDEAPNARSMAIRSLFAQINELDPDYSAYTADGSHMSGNLHQATASFVYTLLTGRCGMFDEPGDNTTTAWLDWRARKVGYETAWTMMTSMGRAPGFMVRRNAASDTLLTEANTMTVTIKFHFKPTHPVTISVSSSNSTAVKFNSTVFTFTPENYATAQTLSLRALPGPVLSEAVDINFITTSDDLAFNQVTDTWKYTISRDTTGTPLAVGSGENASAPIFTKYQTGFHLDLQGNGYVPIKILDAKGNLIQNYPGAKSGYFELPPERFSRGIYFIHYRWDGVSRIEKLPVYR